MIAKCILSLKKEKKGIEKLVNVGKIIININLLNKQEHKVGEPGLRL